jgi:hypothetical protein
MRPTDRRGDGDAVEAVGREEDRKAGVCGQRCKRSVEIGVTLAAEHFRVGRIPTPIIELRPDQPLESGGDLEAPAPTCGQVGSDAKEPGSRIVGEAPGPFLDEQSGERVGTQVGGNFRIADDANEKAVDLPGMAVIGHGRRHPDRTSQPRPGWLPLNHAQLSIRFHQPVRRATSWIVSGPWRAGGRCAGARLAGLPNGRAGADR